MHFTLSSVLITLVVVSAAASPTEKEAAKRGATSKFGKCNGTSCRVGLYQKKCNKGSCAGPNGGDGSKCSIVDYPNNSNEAFCPGCGNSDLC